MSKKNWLPLTLRIKIRKFWRAYRRPLLIILPLLILFLGLLPILKKSWLNYPAPLRAKIALSYLLADKSTGVACRETCQKQRQQYLNLIFRGGGQARSETEKALVSSSTSPEIRSLLIKGWQSAAWEAPEPDILTSAPSLGVQTTLIEAWPELAPANWWAEISNRFYASQEDEERLLILKNLLGRQDPVAEELVVAVLMDPDYLGALQEQAYFLWANLPERERAQDLMPLAAWGEILLRPDYSGALKEMIIWGLTPAPELISEGEEIKELLKIILSKPEDFDAHLRLAAESILADWVLIIPDSRS
ncbi:MAG: hypothetical protein JST_000276 [Candidatus Parcubacteria bacterium]